MATGASTADVAVILVDARKGVLTQTRRHSFIVSLLGIKHVALAVNKMDLVGYDQAVFDRIAADYREFAAGLGLTDVTAIPISALRGDNVVEPGANMPWYDGPPLPRTWKRSRPARTPPAARSGSRAAGHPARPRLPRLRRHHRRRDGAPGRRGTGAPSGATARWSGSSPPTATCRRPRQGSR